MRKFIPGELTATNEVYSMSQGRDHVRTQTLLRGAISRNDQDLGSEVVKAPTLEVITDWLF